MSWSSCVTFIHVRLLGCERACVFWNFKCARMLCSIGVHACLSACLNFLSAIRNLSKFIYLYWPSTWSYYITIKDPSKKGKKELPETWSCWVGLKSLRWSSCRKNCHKCSSVSCFISFYRFLGTESIVIEIDTKQGHSFW